MRTYSISFMNMFQHPIETSWDNGVHALKSALKLETHVTRKIVDIIKECEAPNSNNPANDYHVSLL